jgi:hypothetical protein
MRSKITDEILRRTETDETTNIETRTLSSGLCSNRLCRSCFLYSVITAR